MKRILIFSLAYYPRFIGGAEIAVKEITDRLSETEFVFDMVTLRFDSNLPRFERIGNVNVHRIGFSKKSPSAKELVMFPLYVNKIFYPVTAFFKAIALDRKNRYDSLWSVMTYMGFPAVFFKLFHRKSVSYLLTLQDGDSIEHITKRWRIRIVHPLLKSVFKKADCVQTISNYLGNFAREMGYAGEIRVVPNGADVHNFKLQIADFKLQEMRRKLGVKENEKIIITTSRLVEKNAVDVVIRALPFLPEDVKFLIVGDGSLEEKLKALARQESVAERVIFLGNISNENISPYLHASDVFIRPSRSEGMGISFIEAMAAGVPVVGTAVGGITDFLDDGETGLVCEVDNPQNIAEKISTLLTNQQLRGKVTANARNLAEERYDWDMIAQSMKDIFIELLKGKHSQNETS